MTNSHPEFSRYEIARILGARALQISMDAPLLLKISDDELRVMRFDAIKIAEKEFFAGALPISVRRPMPKKVGGKLVPVREEAVDDEKIIEKEKEVEAEIAEKAEEMGFVNEDETDSAIEETPSSDNE